MLILGWHGGIRSVDQDMPPGWSTHDGAAVLVRGGEVLAAVEEERLNRVKHSNFFPAEAMRRCLAVAGVTADEINIVAMNFSERVRDIFPADAGLPSVESFLEDSTSGHPTVRGIVSGLFRRYLDTDVSEKLFFADHHVAHLWSAWGPAGFSEALVLSLDGSGDAHSGMVAHGTANGLEVLRELGVADSLGNLYSDTIRLLGYHRFDEYKAMGIAPYGDPARFRRLFTDMVALDGGGKFRLVSRTERWGMFHDADLIRWARRAGAEFEQIHCDIAAGLQECVEKAVFHLLEHFVRETGVTALGYAGGVAHNCSLNGMLLRTGLFEKVFVQGAAHDAGGALGAALLAAEAPGRSGTVGGGWREKTGPGSLFLGTPLPAAEAVAGLLGRWDGLVEVEQVADPASQAADILAAGAVVGWVQGRSEFGPRALGHRSILADPRPARNKDRINTMVKKREAFRPFAPAVLVEYLESVFEIPKTRANFAFMTYTLLVRDAWRSRLAAVTHVDGTARVQSVSADADPQFWRLIDQFRVRTGVPAVLNTSFNNNAEPIIDSVDDAVVCFLTTGIDALIIDHFLVRRCVGDLAEATDKLCPSLPRSRKLTQRSIKLGADVGFAIESNASSHFQELRIDIDRELFMLLLRADGATPLKGLMDQCGVADAARRAGTRDAIRDLWSRRAVRMLPGCPVQAH